MEKLINIAGLLEECKQYTKLYSVTHGDVLLDRIDKEGNIFLKVLPLDKNLTLKLDEWGGYDEIDKSYYHYTVDHGKGQYVNGRIYFKMKMKNHSICHNIMLHFSLKILFDILYCDKSIKSLLLINTLSLSPTQMLKSKIHILDLKITLF